jgi:hypothetical protein
MLTCVLFFIMYVPRCNNVLYLRGVPEEEEAEGEGEVAAAADGVADME